MSQYPQYPQYPTPQPPYGGYPYYPPNAYAFDPNAHLKGPARRAGLLMMILGLLGLALAGSCLWLPEFIDWAMQNPDVPPAQKLEFQQKIAEAKGKGVTMRHVAWFYTGILAAPMLALLILAPFVRRAAVPAIWFGIVVTGAVLLGVAALSLASLVGGAQMLPVTCTVVAIGALFVLQLVWLIQGVRAAGRMTPQQAMPGYGQPMPGYYGGAGYPAYGGYPSYGQPLPPPPGGQAPVGQPPASPQQPRPTDRQE